MFTHILAIVDASQGADAVLHQCCALAQASGAKLTLTTVIPKSTVAVFDAPGMVEIPTDDFQDRTRAQARALLEQQCNLATARGTQASTLLLEADEPARAVSLAAQEQGCDLIAVASEAHNALVRLLSGSIIPGLITASPVSVLICKTAQA
jgi:nucleotide-binding universal stress UspA family protein